MREAGLRAECGGFSWRFAGAVAVCGLLAGSAGAQSAPSGAPTSFIGPGFVGLAAAGLAVDGSVELAYLQPESIGFPALSTGVVVQNFSGAGETGGTHALTVTATVSQNTPAVAALVPSGFVVAWSNQEPQIEFVPRPGRLRGRSTASAVGAIDTVSARIFDATGQPTGQELELNVTSPALDVRVGALSSGGFVASYLIAGGQLVARLFDGSGAPLSGELAVSSGSSLRNVGVAPLGDGGFFAAWDSPDGGYFVQRFDAAGSPLTAAANPTHFDGGPAALAANAAGQVAFAWMTTDPTLQPLTSLKVQLYDSTLQAVGPARTLEAPAMLSDPFPLLGAVAVNLKGESLVAWSHVIGAGVSNALAQTFDAQGNLEGGPVQVNLTTKGVNAPLSVLAQQDGSWSVVLSDNTNATLQRLSATSCSLQTSSLCLGANRFRLDATFVDPRSGVSGTAQPVALDAATGGFWFFDARNPELVVKVLDGTPVNGHLWVFFASLSTVEFDLTVTDTLSGAQRVYHNAAGVQASQADTGAFTPAVINAALRPALQVSPPKAAAVDDPVAQICSSSSSSLCLGSSRFSMTVAWSDPESGRSGTGTTQQLSGESGAYWFFDPSNVELAVKVLDGRAINGHFWVFYAALTAVEFDLTIVDNSSPQHASRTYHKAAGVLAAKADTSAF